MLSQRFFVRAIALALCASFIVGPAWATELALAPSCGRPIAVTPFFAEEALSGAASQVLTYLLSSKTLARRRRALKLTENATALGALHEGNWLALAWDLLLERLSANAGATPVERLLHVVSSRIQSRWLGDEAARARQKHNENLRAPFQRHFETWVKRVGLGAESTDLGYLFAYAYRERLRQSSKSAFQPHGVYRQMTRWIEKEGGRVDKISLKQQSQALHVTFRLFDDREIQIEIEFINHPRARSENAVIHAINVPLGTYDGAARYGVLLETHILAIDEQFKITLDHELREVLLRALKFTAEDADAKAADDQRNGAPIQIYLGPQAPRPNNSATAAQASELGAAHGEFFLPAVLQRQQKSDDQRRYMAPSRRSAA